MFRFLFGSGSSNKNYGGFAVDAFTISEAPATNASFKFRCSGSSSIVATPNGGGCPDYSWNFGDPASGVQNSSTQTNPLHVFSGPGIFKVMLATSRPDAKPDTSYQTVIIHTIDTRILSTPDCRDVNGGSAVVLIEEAVKNPSVTWDTEPQQTAALANKLSAGDYIVTVSGTDACPQRALVTIKHKNPAGITATASTILPACNTSDGSITISAAGGNGGYSYQWVPNVSSDHVARNLKAGLYKVTATDGEGCSQTIAINLSSKNGPAAVVQNKQDAICHGAGNGWASINTTGGVAPYTYQWWPRGGNESSADLLTAGEYVVTVTDQNNCISTPFVKISEPAAIKPNIQQYNTVCGLLNGSISALPSGGTAPYKFSWNDAYGSDNFGSQPNIGQLSPGSYYLTITDYKSCMHSDTVEIAASIGISTDVSYKMLSCSSDASGSATIQISGGSPPYNIRWSNGVSGDRTEKLPAGSHSVTVTDGICSAATRFQITQPSAISFNLKTKEATCGNPNGEMEAMITGGSPPYQFRWPTGTNSSPVATGLLAGAYSVMVTDRNGCESTAAASIKNSNPLSISLGADTGICSNQETIILSPGNFDNYRWQDGSTAPSFSAHTPGLYRVTVTHQGCVASSSIQIAEDCGEIYFPSAITPNGDGKNDQFGPLGGLTFVKDYRLIVYNRWGQAVFQTSNPLQKWNGKTVGTIIPGTYVWVAHFNSRLEQKSKRSGTVMIVL